MDEGSVGALVTDPPYLISFMGKEWDKELEGRQQQTWHEQWLAECYRVLRPGGVAKVFSATRTYHRVAAAMEEVGFELRPEHSLEAWGYGCLSEDAEILTESGWKLGVEVRPGERVACWDSKTGAIHLDAVQEVICKPYVGDMVVFRNDHTDQLLTPNHRVYHKPLNEEVQVALADSLVGQWVRLPVKNRWGIGYTMAQGTTEHYEGDVWCVRVPTGAFVARRADKVFITGNSGFPKYLNTSKAIDAHLGKTDERAVIGQSRGVRVADHQGHGGIARGAVGIVQEPTTLDVTTGATEESRRFEGFATALKPGWEPFVIGVKST